MPIFREPAPSSGELHFRIFDVPVRVHPMFWVITVFMGLSDDTKAVLIWVAVVFSAILVHELGHVAAFRFFGNPSHVVLYSFGGLAVPERGGRLTMFEDIVISAAGPVAGFVFGGVVLAATLLAGGQAFFETYLFVIPNVGAFVGTNYYLNMALNDLLYVNLYWGLMNLLPVSPLDGGRIAEAALTQRDPFRGARHAAILSAACGALIAGLALYSGFTYLFFMFGFLAISSIQTVERQRPRWS